MDYIMTGGKRLYGEISVYGAKNCVLPMLGASVLTDDEIVLRNCPNIVDVQNMIKLLRALGKKVVWQDDAIIVKGALTSTSAPQSIAKLLRGSALVLGSALARYGEIDLPLPGGCAIGKRPMDIHLAGLEKMGVRVNCVDNALCCRGYPVGADYSLRFPSVGATENLLCSAVLSKGETTLSNCATEPEVSALARLLSAMGGRIEGIGTPELTIKGVKTLHGAEFTVIPDRIVTATYLSAVMSAGGKVSVTNCNPQHLRAFLNLICTRARVEEYSDAITVERDVMPSGYGSVTTAPYPFFPTDMQSLVLALASCSDGEVTVIRENLFENRLTNISGELAKMGADIRVNDNVALVKGRKLFGAEVTAYDLRGGASLVVAGLNAEGQTIVRNIENVCRGYLDLGGSLRLLGADIVQGEG